MYTSRQFKNGTGTKISRQVECGTRQKVQMKDGRAYGTSQGISIKKKPNYILQNKTTQRAATIIPNSECELKPREFIFTPHLNTIKVNAKPEFGANFGSIKAVDRTFPLYTDRSCREYHTEPQLINTLYGNRDKKDWKSANEIVKAKNYNPKFELFTEREPCSECKRYLSDEIYTNDNIVKYCTGIHTTKDIINKFHDKAIQTAEQEYKDYDFSNKTIEFELDYPGALVINSVKPPVPQNLEPIPTQEENDATETNGQVANNKIKGTNNRFAIFANNEEETEEEEKAAADEEEENRESKEPVTAPTPAAEKKTSVPAKSEKCRCLLL